MNKTLKVIIAIPALLFILVGIGWLLEPAQVAIRFGMPLLDGLGGSTQIGDLGAFFMGGGVIVIIGLVTEKREWFYAAALLLAGAAFFRTASWVLHGMPFATEQIAIEVILTALMLFAASRLTKA
jgi:hypothetical protein